MEQNKIEIAAAAIYSALKDLDTEASSAALADALRKDEEKSVLPFYMIYRIAQVLNATKVEFIVSKEDCKISFYNKEGKIDLSRGLETAKQRQKKISHAKY